MDQKVHLEKLAQKPKAGFSEFRFSGVLLLIPGLPPLEACRTGVSSSSGASGPVSEVCRVVSELGTCIPPLGFPRAIAIVCDDEEVSWVVLSNTSKEAISCLVWNFGRSIVSPNGKISFKLFIHRLSILQSLFCFVFV